MRRALFPLALFVGVTGISLALTGCGDLTKPNYNQIQKDPDVKPANDSAPKGVMGGGAQGQGAATKAGAANGATGAAQPAGPSGRPSPIVQPAAAPRPMAPPQRDQPSCGG